MPSPTRDRICLNVTQNARPAMVENGRHTEQPETATTTARTPGNELSATVEGHTEATGGSDSEIRPGDQTTALDLTK